MIRSYFLFGSLLLFWGCNNIEDAKPSSRKTFIHFYEAAHNLYGVSAEPTDEGYIILGNETLANGNQNSVIIRTDSKGEKIASDIIIEGGYSNSLQVAQDGYYLIGDSIKTNLESTDVADLEIYSARIFKLSLSGAIMKKLVIADRKDTIRVTDIHGNAIAFNNQGNILTLGTFKDANQAEKAYVASFDPSTFDTLWTKEYDLLGRNYQNSRSLHTTPSGKIIWASDLIVENQSFSKSYLTVPYLEENSTFLNYGQFGATTDQHLSVSDIQPASSAAFGFAVVGSYSSINNTGSNVFFIRVNQFGDIIDGSERFFDGETLSQSNNAVNANESISEDTGNAIASTSDGGFIIGGSINKNNVGMDILLIKVDRTGSILWNKVIGGAGNEIVTSIRETSDGGFLVCGTNDLLGLSSIFLLKTDSNGDLKD